MVFADPGYFVLVMCGDLNRDDPDRLTCLKTQPIKSGTIKRCDLAGESVSLWGWALEDSYAQAMPSVTHSLLLLLAD